jgi:hypothetical protein
MKRILATLLVVGTITFQACEGPVGPPGMDGQDGVNIVGEVFEVEADFTSVGNFGFVDPYGFDILESDKVMVYRLSGIDGEDRDIWRLLPQTFYVQQGIFTYNFDFTYTNYSVFIDSNFDLNTLTPEYTEDQIFRVLIIPADRIDVEARIDYSDHDAVLRMLNVNENTIPRRQLN